MHRTLLLLSKLRFVGHWRKMKRSLATPMGMLMAVVSVGFIAMMLLPRLLVPRVPHQAFTPVSKLMFHPALLFLLWLSTLVGSRLKSPIAFSMPEMEFLFAGPFTRRQLLVHKLLMSALGPLGFAVMAPLVFPFVWWPAALVGVLLMATFMQWWTILLALAMDWIGTRFRVLRWLLLVAAVTAAAASFWQSGAMEAGLPLGDRLAALESSWAGRIILAPFAVFSRLISATAADAMLAWGTGALVMVWAVAWAILKLDGYFVEASLEASRKRYESLERLKRTGGAVGFRVRSRPAFALPRLPRLLGAGTIAWRQGLEIVRSSGGPVAVIAVPAAIGLMVAVPIRFFGRYDIPPMPIILALTLVVGFLITMLPMGLRADLDHIDVLKTLPISSNAIVFGSVTAAIAYITFTQLVTVACMAAVLNAWFPAAPLAAAAALPITVLSVATDSVLVVLFPSIRRFIPGDPLVAGRIMLVSLAKVMAAVVAVAVAGVPVLVALLLGSEKLVLPIAVGYAVLVVEGLAIVWVAAVLFAACDVSAHLAERE